jgi:hypothetical protein
LAICQRKQYKAAAVAAQEHARREFERGFTTGELVDEVELRLR